MWYIVYMKTIIREKLENGHIISLTEDPHMIGTSFHFMVTFSGAEENWTETFDTLDEAESIVADILWDDLADLTL